MLLASCRRERRDEFFEYSSSEPSANVTPELREYALTSQRAWYYMSLATSYRRISEQPRDGKILHSESELSCPDKCHLLVTGAADYERYVIGDQQWERRNTKQWTHTTIGPPFADLAACKWKEQQARRRPPDEADIAMMLPRYGSLTVSKLGRKTYQGIECEEYSTHWQEGGPNNTVCFSLGDHPYVIHNQWANTFNTTFDFNKPIDIRPPKTE